MAVIPNIDSMFDHSCIDSDTASEQMSSIGRDGSMNVGFGRLSKSCKLQYSMLSKDDSLQVLRFAERKSVLHAKSRLRTSSDSMQICWNDVLKAVPSAALAM
jgi:hypothetical protein